MGFFFISQRYTVFGKLKQALSTVLNNFNWIKANRVIMPPYELESGGNKLLGKKWNVPEIKKYFLHPTLGHCPAMNSSKHHLPDSFKAMEREKLSFLFLFLPAELTTENMCIMPSYLQRQTSEHEPILCYQSRQISPLPATNKLHMHCYSEINTSVVNLSDFHIFQSRWMRVKQGRGQEKKRNLPAKKQKKKENPQKRVTLAPQEKAIRYSTEKL